MSTPGFTSSEERVAARALVGSRTRDQRLRYIERETGLKGEQADALLRLVREQKDTQRAGTRAFVAAMTDSASESVWPVLGLHGLIAAGTLAVAGYFVSTDRWFLGLVCVGVAVSNLWVARSALLRSRRHPRSAVHPESSSAAPEPTPEEEPAQEAEEEAPETAAEAPRTEPASPRPEP